MDMIENRPYHEIQLGDTASVTKRLSFQDIQMYSALTGNVNPTHLDRSFAQDDEVQDVRAPGMWLGTLISSVLGGKLPGPGTVYESQYLHFTAAVVPGDELTVHVRVLNKLENHRVILDCRVTNQHGVEVVSGRAVVRAPIEKVVMPRHHLPELRLHDHGARHRQMVARAAQLGAVPTAVVHPTDEVSLLGPLQAFEAGLIEPVLVGPEFEIRRLAEKLGASLKGVRIVDMTGHKACARKAVEMVHSGEVQALMKGQLHTDDFMGAVVAREGGLRTGRRISHVFAMDVPTYDRVLLVTDAAINIYPDLTTKADIVSNAIDLAHVMGVAKPKVAILSAVETVNPKIASTMDAAALCKMADRGQIKGGVLDGPLAFDNAVSKAAALTKGIISPVAGEADILLTPDLESGNMVAKQLEYLAGAEGAGIVMGARVPIILTSRADGVAARLASCALANLVANAGKAGAADKIREVANG